MFLLYCWAGGTGTQTIKSLNPGVDPGTFTVPTVVPPAVVVNRRGVRSLCTVLIVV